MRTVLFAAAAALLLASPATTQSAYPAPAQSTPSEIDYPGLLASEIRTAADRAADERRQALATLNFIGIQPGWKVADLIIGGGYFTRIFSSVVGLEGHVTAWQPEEFVAFQASYGEALEVADQLPNVDAVSSPIGAPELPSGLDMAFTAQNYHDLHLDVFPDDTAARVNAAVFEALKPGGLYVIIDHDAAPGSDLSVAEELHRIDQATVVQEVQAAGFVLRSASSVLSRDDDPRTANVFDESIRGRTSQFMLVFRKPD